MREPRERNDQMDTTYVVKNQLAGRNDEKLIGSKDRRAFRRLAERLCGLFVVRVDFLQLHSGGYTMQLSAPAALPSRAVVEARYRAHYGSTAKLPDFDDPEVLLHCANRLRDFSEFVKDLQQCFTTWMNKVKFAGERQGPGWCGRFKSKILGPARHLFAWAAGSRPWLGRARLATDGRAGQVPRRFLEQHPALADMLEGSAKLGIALCIFVATRRIYPLQRLIMK